MVLVDLLWVGASPNADFHYGVCDLLAAAGLLEYWSCEAAGLCWNFWWTFACEYEVVAVTPHDSVQRWNCYSYHLTKITDRETH